MEKVKYRKYKSCPYCKSGIELLYKDLRDRLETVEDLFTICQCKNCGLVFTNPIPTRNLNVLYPTNYLSSNKNNGFDLERWYREDQYKFDFSVLKKIGLSLANIDSYLDIGCGSGERVSFLRSMGCKRALGLDRYDNLKTRLENIVNSEIIGYFPEKKYKLVSMFHVLEHISDIDKTIKHIKDNVLSEGGYLLIQVPNFDSYERFIFKNKWFCFDTPRHLWHFNKRFLTNLFKKNSLKIKYIKAKNAFLHPVSIGASIQEDIDIQRIWTLNKPPVYKILWILVTLLTIPFSLVQSLLGRASMLTLLLKNNN